MMIITFHGNVEPVVCEILHSLRASGFLSVNGSTVSKILFYEMKYSSFEQFNIFLCHIALQSQSTGAK